MKLKNMSLPLALLTASAWVTAGAQTGPGTLTSSPKSTQINPKNYRLTYTITQLEDGKRIGTQHLAIIVLLDGRTMLKQGNKIPVVTGTYTSSTNSTQSQFTYLDIGLNFDASLDSYAEGLKLRTKVEVSSVADDKPGPGPQDPIVRQTVLEGSSLVTVGKPLVLGSLDIPDSPRHLDIEVEVDPVH